jgi:hypothetical protein
MGLLFILLVLPRLYRVGEAAANHAVHPIDKAALVPPRFGDR